MDYPELHEPRLDVVRHLNCMEDGVYFGLDEDTYHAEPRLSASGMKHLKASCMDFWARSWMNPDKPEDEDTDSKELGRAYHKRILEGSTAFSRAYGAKLEYSDFPNALRTAEDLKGELERRGLKVSGTKEVLSRRLLLEDPDLEIWDVLVAQHAEANEGRILLPFTTIKRIEIAAAMIDKHPQLSKCVSGGYAEVTVFWTDPEYGVPMKARLDYLRMQAISDLKSFSNPLGKPIDAAIYAAMAGRKYHIQAAQYLDAAMMAKAMIRAGRVFGEVDGAWAKRFAEAPEPTFVFIFQQTGPAPVARGKVFPRRSMWQVGQAEVRHATHLFAECLRKFGTDPWVDDSPLEEFDDALFPAYATE